MTDSGDGSSVDLDLLFSEVNGKKKKFDVASSNHSSSPKMITPFSPKPGFHENSAAAASPCELRPFSPSPSSPAARPVSSPLRIPTSDDSSSLTSSSNNESLPCDFGLTSHKEDHHVEEDDHIRPSRELLQKKNLKYAYWKDDAYCESILKATVCVVSSSRWWDDTIK